MQHTYIAQTGKMKFSLSLGKWKMKTKKDKWLTSVVAQQRYRVPCCLSPFEVTLTCHTFSASYYLSLFFILFKTLNSTPHFLDSISSLITTHTKNITLSLILLYSSSKKLIFQENSSFVYLFTYWSLVSTCKLCKTKNFEFCSFLCS